MLFPAGVHPGQGADHLDMLGVGEHIHGGAAVHSVALLGQQGKVPCQGLGVAADVDHPPGCHLHHALEELRGGAFPGRIHKDHVRPLPCLCRFADPAGGVGGKEPGVLYPVVPGVAYGVLYGVPVQLHSHHLLCPVCGGETNGADAAVGVQHHLFAGELCRLHRQTVQHLGLDGVHLIKAPGAEGVGPAAESVQNVPLAVEHLFCFPQHHAGLAAVEVLHHGGDGDPPFFCFCQQRLDKVLCPGQHRLRRHQHHHHLSRCHAPAQQAVTQKPGALVLVVGLVAAGVGGGTHRLHGLIQHLILQQAAFHRQYPVAVGGVDAGGEFSTGSRGKGGDHLIAVVPWLCHTPDGVHRTIPPHKGTNLIFLLFQLGGVVQPQQGAAAAVFCLQLAIHCIPLLYP